MSASEAIAVGCGSGIHFFMSPESAAAYQGSRRTDYDTPPIIETDKVLKQAAEYFYDDGSSYSEGLISNVLNELFNKTCGAFFG